MQHRIPHLSMGRSLALFAALTTSGLVHAQSPAPSAKTPPETKPAPVAAQPSDTAPGVTFRIYQVQGDIKAIPTLEANQTPNVDELRPTIDFAAAAFPALAAPIVAKVQAYLDIATRGSYEFRLTSDDGSRLRIDDILLIDHDGRHGATSKTSNSTSFDTGRHNLLVEYFDSGGNRRLTLEWKPPGATAFTVIPATSLSTEFDPTRVTSPGVKAIRSERRPGDGTPVIAVHPAFNLSTINIEGFEPRVSAMTFASDGRLIIGTFNPLQRDDTKLPDIDSKQPDHLYAITGITGEPDAKGNLPGAKMTIVADGVYEPLGLCAVGDVLYVSHRKAITRLIDKDHDGFYETHEDVASGWEAWNYHQFTFGLVHRDNHLYATLSTAMAPPGWEGMHTNAAPNGPMRGGILDVDLSSNTVSVIAGGCRAPNGIGFGPGGAIFYSDNQGTWFPTSQLNEIVPGRFYGHFNNPEFVLKLAERFPNGGAASSFCDQLTAPATLFLPQNELDNSPTQPILIEQGPYAGQMLIGDLTAGGLRRAFLEKINGQWQGAVFQFTQGLNCGVNRVAWAPDGSLYIGGLGAQGNWNWNNTKFGLQRLTPSGKVPFEMLAVRALPSTWLHDTERELSTRYSEPPEPPLPMGFEIEFTKPVAVAWLADPKNYEISEWTYTPTAEYGGPKIDDHPLIVTHATPSRGGLRVSLAIPGLKAGYCVHIRTDPKSVDGEQMWATEAWYTLSTIPRDHLIQPANLRLALAQADPEPTTDSLIGPPRKSGEPTSNGAPATTSTPRHHEYATIKIIPDALGVGVFPPAEAVSLIGRSARNAFVAAAEKDNAPTDARTQKEISTAPPYVEMIPEAGDLTTRASFGDCRLHVEWYCPPGGEGQRAANSGVYIQNRYELQILGTLAGVPPEKSDAGAIYNFKAPDVNASTGPGTWQSYDAWFRAPRFKDGKKAESARLTLYWNGTLVHNNVEIPAPTGSAAAIGEKSTDPIQIAPLRLQVHASAAQGPVRFRNVWIAPLEATPDTPHTTADWINLFDGSTLTGWVTRGGIADFRAENGEIIGTSRPNSPNTFLVLERPFDNFELLLEVKQNKDLNSGIQIRSIVEGGEGGLDNRSGRLIGYQVELDPSPRAYTGGIYEEGRRGWLAPLIDAPYARVAYHPGEWNHVRIVASGPIVRTWINGVPAASLFDAAAIGRHIALQVHDVGDKTDPLEVRFRTIRVRELSSPPVGMTGEKQEPPKNSKK